LDDDSWFDSFFAEGLITDVLLPLKSGKEASVWLCRANPRTTGAELLAVKAYRPRQGRTFRNDAVYREGRVITNARTRRAVERKTRFGREAGEAFWVGGEYEALRALHGLGCDVPRPVSMGERAILMEYVGDDDRPAPQLRDVDLEPDEAPVLFDRLLRNVEMFLAANVVHADLSAYNVLYREGAVRIIDFPQAVDARSNRSARDLLARDVENLCRYFARYGVPADGGAISARLWSDFLFARL
jgi:RIO kinase 1